jgi:transcription elongation factor Elf1
MAGYNVNEIIGNMRIVKQSHFKITLKGRVNYYDAECQHCGRVRNISHDALRKRKNTGAIKCTSCSQEKPEDRRSKRTHNPGLGYELAVDYALFKKFISSR